MPRPITVRRIVPITLELLVEVSGTINPAEPDVGISDAYIEDLTIERIGTDTNEPGDKVDWMLLDHLAPEAWLTGCIIEQCGDQLEEKLFDANS